MKVEEMSEGMWKKIVERVEYDISFEINDLKAYIVREIRDMQEAGMSSNNIIDIIERAMFETDTVISVLETLKKEVKT